MNLQTENHLTCFNRLVLEFQDEAFTLAWYLVGDEEQAAAAVQAAILQLYRQNSGWEANFHIGILQATLQACKKRSLPCRENGRQSEIPACLRQTLNLEEFQVQILVNVLKLDGQQAAQVMDCSRKKLAELLARSYQKLCGKPVQLEMM